jgi:uncharacterized protein (TIGR02302 family)
MATEPSDTPTDTHAPAPIPRVRLWLARLALVWEHFWPAIWPALGISGLFLAVALLDILPALSPWLHIVVLALFGAAFLMLCWRAIRHLVLPSHYAARRRLEQASGLDHRPLTVMEDRLAGGAPNADTAALWRRHQRRMAEAVRSLRVGVPEPGLPRRDPMSLRGALLLLVVIAGSASWSDSGPRLARALVPDFSAIVAQGRPVLDLWITPPSYTAMAPLFPMRTATPAADGGIVPELDVPIGSVLTAQTQGGHGVPRLVYGDVSTDFTSVDAENSRIETKLGYDGPLTVMQGSDTLGAWKISTIPDFAPSIGFAEPPAATNHFTLRIAYTASDDYGIAKARAQMRRTYESGALIGKEVTEFELPLPQRNVKLATETIYRDFAPHKWAGLPVVLELLATDALGQTGTSGRLKLVLPERVFTHPIARAIIEQRKRLTTVPGKYKAVALALEKISSNPAAFGHDSVVFLALVSARARLQHQDDEAAIPPVRDLLWDTALRLEDGPVSLAERDMRRAQEALMKALAENASDAELERLMRELQRALNRYMQALAEQMRNNPNAQAMEITPDMRFMQGSDFQRMLDQIRKLMRSGARQAAREMLARLQAMLENMRSMQVFRMQRGGTQMGAAMRRLQDLIRRQQQLMNQTFRNSQSMPGMPRPGQGSAAEQRALQNLLRQLRGRLGGRPGQGPGQFLRRAEDAMGRAVRELERGQAKNAVGPQGEAVDQLHRAGRSMIQQFMDRFARQSGTGRNRARQNRPRFDPLGREVMGDDVDTSDVTVPDEADIQRAQKVLDELRRRSGQLTRPRIELDYINRLLQRF